jgi:hypothetical protein
MDLRAVGVYLTYQCNAECIHCAYGSHSHLKGVMEETDIEAAFQAVNRFGKLEAVKILGGEPTLYEERLIRTVELARRHGASNVMLITSGWWGKNPLRAAHLATSLAHAGLSLLLFSIDSFHTPYVRTEAIKGAIRAAAAANLQSCITMNVIESITATNPYDRRTRDLLGDLQDLPTPVMASQVILLGRAAEALSQFYPRFADPLPNRCEPPYAGSFENPSGIAIDPFGYVTLCHGIAIGNTRTKPLPTILAEYRLERHPILHAIATSGPLGLLNLLDSEEVDLTPGYVSSCHLCYDLRKRLRDRYPDYLAPSNCYDSLPDGGGPGCHSTLDSDGPSCHSTQAGNTFRLPMVT